MREPIGVLVREARENQNLAQNVLAAQLEISAAYLCEIEMGRKLPSIPLLGRMATELGLPRDRVLLARLQQTMPPGFVVVKEPV